jgi:translation elongation factor EF-4
MTHTISARDYQAQVLDDMDLERERGNMYASQSLSKMAYGGMKVKG